MEHSKNGEWLDRPDWEWAERDRSKVVWAEKGCLYRARITGTQGLHEHVKLHDFNGMDF